MVTMMSITAVFFALLWTFCLHIRVGSSVFRMLKRGTCALWALIFLSLIPGMRLGINALNTAALAWLGLPGAVLLQVIALMP